SRHTRSYGDLSSDACSSDLAHDPRLEAHEQVAQELARGLQGVDRAHADQEVKSRGRGGIMLRIVAAAVASLVWAFALAQAPALPKSPVTLNVVDVAGNLALTQEAIENYRAKHPNLVSRITFTKPPAPDLPR